MNVVVTELRASLPPEFEALRTRAAAEGYRFLDRLTQRWGGDAYDDDARASVCGVYADGELAAIGAQTYDQYDPHPEHRRIRHFYVAPSARRCGIGRTLADALTIRAFALAPRLHVRATHALSTAFWDAIGFARVDRADRSHVKVRE